MILERDARTVALIGEDALEKLKNAKVLIAGIGGVGGYIAEALVRAGVGTIGIVDSDRVAESNINRQIIADYTTLGRLKTDVMEERIGRINPDCTVRKYPVFYPDGEGVQPDVTEYDYVADAIDSVSSKVHLIKACIDGGVPVISSMGTGNKLHGDGFVINDISRTSVCPLAKAVRKRLREAGIEEGVKVLFSKEPPAKTGSRTPASISFVPPAAGLMMAGEIIRDIIGGKDIEHS